MKRIKFAVPLSALLVISCGNGSTPGSDPGELGHPCSETADCAEGLVCAGEICRDPCTTAADCTDALHGCREGACGPCGSADDCRDDEYCERGDCLARVENGEHCLSDAACLGGNCLEGTCCPAGCLTTCAQDQCLLDLGARCSLPGECLSGHCADGVCCQSACDTDCLDCNGSAPGTCEVLTSPDCITGTLVVNAIGVEQEIAVEVTGPVNTSLVTDNGMAIQPDLPGGTYTVACENLAPYFLQMSNDDATIDAPGELIVFTCHYTFEPHWIAVGLFGTILLSHDGQLWSDSVGPAGQSFNAVAHGNLVGFHTVAAATDGAIYISHDLVNWVRSEPWPGSVPDNMIAIVHVDDMFYMADERGRVWRTENGVDWMGSTLPDEAPCTSVNRCVPNDMAYGGGHWVVVSDQDIWNGQAYWSANGRDWTYSGLDANALYAVAYADILLSYFVAGGMNGEMWWSFDGGDGFAWENCNAPGGAAVSGLAYGNNRFLAVGDSGRVLYTNSGNPTGWTEVTTTQTQSLRAIAYGAGLFVAVGINSHIQISDDDGATWTTVHAGSAQLQGVAYLP